MLDNYIQTGAKCLFFYFLLYIRRAYAALAYVVVRGTDNWDKINRLFIYTRYIKLWRKVERIIRDLLYIGASFL